MLNSKTVIISILKLTILLIDDRIKAFDRKEMMSKRSNFKILSLSG